MKSIKKSLLYTFLLMVMLLAIPTQASAAVKISKKSVTLIKGQSVTLKVTGTKSKAKWSSSKKSIATVSSKGKVVAKKKGTATITAKIGKKKYTCKVKVETPTISKKSITLKKGEKKKIKITGTSQKIAWSSSNKNIATVDKNGIIKAKKEGIATITAKIGKKKYKCKVTIKKKSSKNAETPKNPSSQTQASTPIKTVFGIGETWEVPGQWRITINSVRKSDYRNEFSDLAPAAVYVIEYTYENIGYKDKFGIMNGLFVDFEIGQIVDAARVMGYSYPGDKNLYAQEVPVGARITAQSIIGVNNAGNFTITLSMYDGNGIERTATFICTV